MNAQILALAGVFQSSEIVRQAALHGTWSGYAASTCLDSLFCLESDDVLDIYGGKDRLRLGLESLLGVLGGERGSPQTLQHAVGLLQIQKKFSRDRAMQQTVGDALQEIADETEGLETHEQEEQRVERVADLYTETISQLTPRIVVSGNPQYLQNPRTVAWIRSMLFAGLRSAVLWQQLGGGRFKLLFGRRQLLEDANRILQG